MRRPLQLGAATLALAAGALFAPAMALAHAEIVSITPADGASLPDSPPVLILIFSEGVDPITAVVTLLDERGAVVAGLGTLTVDQPGTRASVPLPSLAPGLYMATYRVASADDGHPTEGSWTFLVDPSGTLPAPDSLSTRGSPSSGLGQMLARWLALATALTVVGVALFWTASARPSMVAEGISREQATAPWVFLSINAGLAFVALAAYLMLDFAAPFGATRFAWAMRLALAGSAAAFMLAVGRSIHMRMRVGRGSLATDRDRTFMLGVMVAGLAALAGSSLAGHPAAVGGPLFAVADWLHLAAVAAWLGTLPGALILARRVRSLPEGRGVVVGAFRRHGRVALVAAPLVALTGLANSPLLLGSARAVAASDYGNLLLAKAFLFSVAIAIGALNFLLARQASGRPVLRLIAGELAVGGLALLVAVSLISTQPAASRALALVRPPVGALQLSGAAADNAVRLSVNLAAPGIQRYQVGVSDVLTGVAQTDIQAMSLVFRPPVETGLPDMRIPLAPSMEAGLWGATGAYTPTAGEWRIAVVVRRTGLPEVATTFVVPVLELPPVERAPPPATGVGVPTPLAIAWRILPAGGAGWWVPGLLLALLAALQLSVRSGRLPSLAAARALLVVLAVASGVALQGRALVEAANAPSAEASSMANPIAPTPQSLERGRLLYLANCASCHGTQGRGDGPTAAGMLPPPGVLGDLVPGRSPGALAFRLANGMLGTAMPAFAGVLTPDERWDLVNYLRDVFPAVP